MTFADALLKAMDDQPKQGRRGILLIDFLMSRPSRRKDRQLARMEKHTRVQLGIHEDDVVDWGGAGINWKKILGPLLDLLLKILPLILAL